MAPRCSDCRFSKPLPNKGRNGDGHEVVVHLCRRHPPQVMMNGQSTYPVVGEDEWCGEFRLLTKLTKPKSKGVNKNGLRNR